MSVMELEILPETTPSIPNIFEEEEFEKKEAEMLDFLLENREPDVEKEVHVNPIKRMKADLLKDLPNYNSIMQLKPSIHTQGGNESKIFEFEKDVKKRLDFGSALLPSANQRKTKQMQLLMDRFILHKTAKKIPKEESITLHITKKEEDSQGIERLVTDTESYLNTTIEEEILPGVSAAGQGSTKEVVPGASYEKLKTSLLSQIRVNKKKRFADKIKEHKMYSDEIDLADKLPIDEEIEDDCTDDEDEESGEEEGDEIEGIEGDEEDEGEGEDLGDEDSESDDEIHMVRKKNKLPEFLDDEAEDSEGPDEDEVDEEGIPDKEDEAFIDDNEVEDKEDLESIASNETNDSFADELANVAKDQSQVINIETEPESIGKEKVTESEKLLDSENVDSEKVIETAKIVQSEKAVQSVIELNGKKKIIPIKISSENWSSDCVDSAFKITSEPTKAFGEVDEEKEIDLNRIQNHVQNPSENSKKDDLAPIKENSQLVNSSTDSQILNSENSQIINSENSEVGKLNNSQVERDSVNSSLFEKTAESEDLFDFFPEKDDQNFSTRSEPPEEVQKLIAKYADDSEDVDLIGLCSGRFPSQREPSPMESQDNSGFEIEEDLPSTVDGMSTSTPLPGMNNKGDLDEETPTGKEKKRISVGRTKLNFGSLLLDEKSSKEAPLSTELKSEELKEKKRKRILEFDSDDEDEEILPKRKSKFDGMNFEDDDNMNTDLSDEDDDDEDDDDADVEEVEYDENEEIVRPKKVKKLMTKTGHLRNEFYENEAELSGSEIGSEDEDEHGLDELEEEEGDKEEIDEEELREQVGRAHLKQVLDEDQRDVLILQDAFLENGDLHTDGAGRQRQFKWKGLDDFDESAVNLANMSDPEEVEIEEAEAKRVRERIDKIKWMKENSQLFENTSDKEEESEDQLWSFANKKKSIGPLRKRSMLHPESSLSSSNSKKPRGSFSSNAAEDSQNFSNSEPLMKIRKMNESSNNSFSQPVFHSPEVPQIKMKGSFLSRGSPTLDRLAEMAKTSDKVSNVKNNKNFVFSVVTPPEQNTKGNPKKREPVRPFLKRGVEKKPVKINRSFDSLDASSKESSVFGYYK